MPLPTLGAHHSGQPTPEYMRPEHDDKSYPEGVMAENEQNNCSLRGLPGYAGRQCSARSKRRVVRRDIGEPLQG